MLTHRSSIAELDPAPTQQAPAIVEAPPATCAAVANADDSSGITDTVPIQADKDETAAATPFAPQLAAALPALPAQSRAVATSMSPPAESTAQKLEQRSRESLSQLARGLTDLSRLHSSALESQWRFRQGTGT